MKDIRVLVNGAGGRMGKEVVNAVKAEPGLVLAGEADLGGDLPALIKSARADVVVDFTTPAAVYENTRKIIEAGAHAVIGTTNAAEAFVAAAVSAAFLAALVSGHWETDGLTDHLWSVLGLIGGGVIAAPVAGWMTKVLPLRMLTWIVGLVVTGLAIWQAVILFG